MSLRTALVLALFAAVVSTPSLVAAEAAAASSPPGERTALREWSGSVADESLRPGEESWLLIETTEELARIWRAWGRPGDPPLVDLATELVVAQTAKGSVLLGRYRLKEGGDLEVQGISTPDYLPGFRYVIATLSRKGVTTVNGRSLAGAVEPRPALLP